MWRPEGWDRRVYLDQEWGLTRNAAYEAGADAMLEALEKAGVPLAAEDHHPWELGIDQKGTLVFIPQQDSEEKVTKTPDRYPRYEQWAMEAIRLVTNEQRELGQLRFDEIKCIVNRDGHWPECFKDGDSPEDAWREELSALADSV